MSFSGEVKAELADVEPKARHCQISELGAMLEIAGRPYFDAAAGESGLRIRTESADVVRKVFTIADKAFKIGDEFTRKVSDHAEGKRDYEARLKAGPVLSRIARAFGNKDALERTCCRRAYLRGAYLAGGTISDPNRYYHLEIVCADDYAAGRVMGVMREFGLNAKQVERKGSQVVYLKEADQIAEFLRLTGASRMLMEFENIRIMREMRGSVNRQVNCETANLKKTVDAAMKSIEDIRYLREKGALAHMSPALRRAAEARLANPQASLTELGELMNPPVGRSGVNHRLRRLTEMAEELRAKEGQEQP